MTMKIKGQSALRIVKSSLLVFMAIILCCVSILKAEDAVQSAVVVIANKNVVEASLAQKDIESIFLGKKTKWDNKDKITIYTLEADDVHKSFLNDFVNTTPAKFKSHWKKQVFTGKADQPAEYKTEAEMLERVANTNGAVGYVSVAFLEKNPDKVKQLTVVK